jgi:hypothetical protein
VPALRCTAFRPDVEHPAVRVAVARFTPELTRFVLVPGTRDPGGSWSWQGTIPNEERDGLLAAFNAGFRLRDAQGGLFAEGTVAMPLVKHAASFVIDRDGSPDIIAWRGEHRVPRSIVAVRQNLRLIVDDGAPLHGLDRNTHGRWGRLNHRLDIWRSGLGISADGALIYLAGDGLTLASLAQALQHAGAVRAMELDIHDAWPAFNVFQPAESAKQTQLIATKLSPGMRHPAERYLTPDDRDFVAAFVRR